MIFGKGRPPKLLEVGETREVSKEELLATERGALPAVVKIREHHHQIARLAAQGMKPNQIAFAVDMTPQRVSLLLNDPSFAELVAYYRSQPDLVPTRVEIIQTMTENHARAQRLLANQLEDAEESNTKIPLGTLIKVTGDLGDRIGFGKHSTVHVDDSFMARLDRAIERSKLKPVEGPVIEHDPQVPGVRASLLEPAAPQAEIEQDHPTVPSLSQPGDSSWDKVKERRRA